MAYPTVDAPYGFKAINELNGLPYAGATRQIPIASGLTSNLFYGDLVQLTTDGTLIKTTYSTASSPSTVIAGAIGVFVGCQYTNASVRNRKLQQVLRINRTQSDTSTRPRPTTHVGALGDWLMFNMRCAWRKLTGIRRWWTPFKSGSSQL